MFNQEMTAKLKKCGEILRTSLPSACISALCGWFLTLSGYLIFVSDSFTSVPNFASSVPLFFFILSLLLISSAFFVIDKFLKNRVLIPSLLISFALYGVIAVANSFESSSENAYSAFVFTLLALALAAICSVYAKHQGKELSAKDISTRLSFIIVSFAFVLFSAVFIIFLGARTKALCSPCYDMGIFAQMCDNLADSFSPVTTCERGKLLSHFSVHFSPVLYLLTPFCLIFKPTDVLVYAQILLVFSAVFPLFLICRRVKLSNLQSTVISLLFLLYPAMASGGFYDFHENAFLAPLILWTLFFIEADKPLPTFIFAFGVLTVKEDAAMYVAFIALYLIAAKKKYLRGVLMLLMSVGWFAFAAFMLSKGGEGLMLGGRYYNIIGDGGFGELLRVALVDPALYAVESFNAAKLIYFLNMLLPLMFLPLATKKPSRWLLVAPLFIINLITDYQYQFDLGFQYSFGSGALLVYLAAINLADIGRPKAEEGVTEAAASRKGRRTAAFLLTASLLSSLFFFSARIPAQSYYVGLYDRQKENIAVANRVLSGIDRNASVTATSMYLTPLYDVDELYHTSQVFNDDGDIIIYTDVVVLDLREYVSDSDKASRWKRKYAAKGYEVKEEYKNIILVLQRKK